MMFKHSILRLLYWKMKIINGVDKISNVLCVLKRVMIEKIS